jgi:hypothetical protein
MSEYIYLSDVERATQAQRIADEIEGFCRPAASAVIEFPQPAESSCDAMNPPNR